uniref:Histone-lysine N-methyltransferase 2C n=1 Tax=Cacopsylla melanoneura TaxID=428564 RepID=A0A8D9A1L8_9HEMI
MDGICLSETGMNQIRSLALDRDHLNPLHRKKKPTGAYDNIFATIEAVASGQTNAAETDAPPAPLTSGEMAEAARDEPVDYKEGSIVTPLEDGRPPEPPEGFSIHTNEAGQMYLRRKRVRNLNRLGIGGFNVRVRNVKSKDGEEGELPPTTPDTPVTTPVCENGMGGVKRKGPLKKPKSKISQTFPSYLQDAFFGRELLDNTKDTGSQDLDSSESEESEDTQIRFKITEEKTITLSEEELKALEEVKEKQEKELEAKRAVEAELRASLKKEEEDKPEEMKEEEDAEELKDILRISGNLLNDNLLVNTIMNETSIKPEVTGSSSPRNVTSSSQHKDELSEILGSHFNLDPMDTGLPNMDSTDVEELFKGVLTDDGEGSQEGVEFNPTPGTQQATNGLVPLPSAVPPQPLPQQQPNSGPPPPPQSSLVSSLPPPTPPQQQSVIQSGLGPGPRTLGSLMGAAPQPTSLPSVGPIHSNLSSPAGYPSQSPYHSEYSNSPTQFSPAFSEPPSPWTSSTNTSTMGDDPNSMGGDSTSGGGGSTLPGLGGGSQGGMSYNQKCTRKMEQDEELGEQATISCVLYANCNHPELKTEFPGESELREH